MGKLDGAKRAYAVVLLCAATTLQWRARTNAPPDAKFNAEAPRHHHALAKNLHVRPDGTATSENWSGYVVNGAIGSVTDIQGSWIVPAVTCPASGPTYSSFWVGIDGNKGNPTLEQIGTESDCINGTPVYGAWYEFIPNEPVEQPIQEVTVHPGDRIFAEVSFSNGEFTVTLWDETPPPGETTPQNPFEWSEEVKGAKQSSAEWIAEASSINDVVQPLADFGKAFYGETFTGVPETCFATLSGQTNPIGKFPAADVSQTTMTSDGTSTGNPEAIPSPLSKDGSSFSVTSVNFTLLHDFDGADGKQPSAALIQATNGKLYGTTYFGGNGGAGGFGTIFDVTPGGTFTTLYKFCPNHGCANGAWPSAPLVQAADGNFYGTTSDGGTNKGVVGEGTFFEITPGGTLTTLYSFCSQTDCTDGNEPWAVVQAADGNFYGTTLYGGANASYDCCGTIFKTTPSGATTTFYSFCAQTDCTDGGLPLAGLVQGKDGNLYGTTAHGGAHSGGTFFKITPSGALTPLYSFCAQTDCTDGAFPGPLVQGSDGNFYGTTPQGGAKGNGTIFQMTPNGTPTTLYNFSQGGCYVCPTAWLVQDTNGEFYGTTSSDGANNDGTVFSLSVGLGPFLKMQPASGKVAAAVRILGTNLTGATSVRFNGTAAPFKVISSTEIAANVPVGATSGEVQVKTPSGTLSSNVPFQVLPSPRFSPLSPGWRRAW